MTVKKIEELLLQEMEDVKGGGAGISKECVCRSGAAQGPKGDGSCVCSDGGAGQILEYIVVPPVRPCVCPSGAAQ